MSNSLAEQRARMVEEQLRVRGIRDERVLAAMAKVPREEFIAADDAGKAYGDHPVPIGAGQTISQPYIVAAMIEALAVGPENRVLEVGTGTGYQAAILGELAAEVWTIERQPELVATAREILSRLNYANVRVVDGDGSRGLAEHAPYDRILVAAAAPRVPDSLVAQLADGGRLVIPVGTRQEQQVQVVRKIGGEVSVTTRDLCRFVPLVGEEGWDM
jgi:protein-L-isoaspartate(D-aspartate) O-methyltransferase